MDGLVRREGGGAHASMRPRAANAAAASVPGAERRAAPLVFEAAPVLEGDEPLLVPVAEPAAEPVAEPPEPVGVAEAEG